MFLWQNDPEILFNAYSIITIRVEHIRISPKYADKACITERSEGPVFRNDRHSVRAHLCFLKYVHLCSLRCLDTHEFVVHIRCPLCVPFYISTPFLNVYCLRDWTFSTCNLIFIFQDWKYISATMIKKAKYTCIVCCGCQKSVPGTGCVFHLIHHRLHDYGSFIHSCLTYTSLRGLIKYDSLTHSLAHKACLTLAIVGSL